MGQTIIALSYLSALLMRVDLETEKMTVDQIGTALIALNIREYSNGLSSRCRLTQPVAANSDDGLFVLGYLHEDLA